MAIGKRRIEEESQIDLTPMLDVVFIMLIFFIVTASFINETAIEVQRPPTTDAPPDLENRNIVFDVGPMATLPWGTDALISARCALMWSGCALKTQKRK